MAENGEVTCDTKETKLLIDGMKYKITAKKRTSPSPEEQFNKKLQANLEKQEEEVNALTLIYNEKFKVEDELNKKYSVELFIRGAPDANIQFFLPPQYPSDVPPTYTLNAPWMRKKSRAELSQSLSNIFTENFGRCIVYMWVDKICEDLKKEIQELKENPQQEEHPVTAAPKPVGKEESGAEVHRGSPIWDRGSCFSPYLAKVTSEADVKKVIAQIEQCKKVSNAWRNTYAYRYTTPKGTNVEVGEDGGEPKAGRNLLQRLINYQANNLIVYISRRVGSSLLGPDRYKHLNNAADDVLIACGYKPEPKGQKDNQKGQKDNQKGQKDNQKAGKNTKKSKKVKNKK